MFKQQYIIDICNNKASKDLICVILEVLDLFARIYIKRILPNYKMLIYPLVYYILTREDINSINKVSLKVSWSTLKEFYKYEIGVRPFRYIFKDLFFELLGAVNFEIIESK